MLLKNFLIVKKNYSYLRISTFFKCQTIVNLLVIKEMGYFSTISFRENLILYLVSCFFLCSFRASIDLTFFLHYNQLFTREWALLFFRSE
ncbi:hypothetical protein AB834_03330 [PVC group bacterium (ex Bugula neritina AB1)]|nr:hypothetical protein AB834_03330 [PVC group bacterium (ex Bugula neritina AB1)]